MPDLTPTEELMLEVLAARHRLGETHWTFTTRQRPAAKRLASRGLVEWKSGIVEDTILVWLTDAGRDASLSSTYNPPIAAAADGHWDTTPTARVIELTEQQVTEQWNALFDAHPWLEGLEADGSCGDVLCCPGGAVQDWGALSEAGGLLFLAGGFPRPLPRLTRDLLP